MGEKIMDGFPSREEALADFFAAWEPARSVEYVALDDAVGRVLACDLASTTRCRWLRASLVRRYRGEVGQRSRSACRPRAAGSPGPLELLCAPTPETTFPRRVRRRHLGGRGRVPPDLRIPVHLFYVEGYATEEIARITGCRPSNRANPPPPRPRAVAEHAGRRPRPTRVEPCKLPRPPMPKGAEP